MAKNHILTDELFTSIARKYGCSPGTLSLSWAVQRGTTVIPKSSSEARIVENIRLITLDDGDMVISIIYCGSTWTEREHCRGGQRSTLAGKMSRETG